MPIYEYVCPSCETKFELLRPFSRSSEDAPCPKCQSVAKRVLSVFACFAKDADGVSTSLGSSACGTCSATSCAGCGLSPS